MNPADTVIRLPPMDIAAQLQQVRSFLQEARYKQAIRILNETLIIATSLEEQLLTLAYRVFAYALWRQQDLALADANQAIRSVCAELPPVWEIDWEHEKKHDVGHLTFLGTLFNLRGVLYRAGQKHERAVEDFSTAILMTSTPALNQLNYLHRACALLSLKECLPRAQNDLELALQINRTETLAWFQLQDIPNGVFTIKEQALYFCGLDQSVEIDPRYFTLTLNALTPECLTFYRCYF